MGGTYREMSHWFLSEAAIQMTSEGREFYPHRLIPNSRRIEEDSPAQKGKSAGSEEKDEPAATNGRGRKRKFKVKRGSDLESTTDGGSDVLKDTTKTRKKSRKRIPLPLRH